MSESFKAEQAPTPLTLLPIRNVLRRVLVDIRRHVLITLKRQRVKTEIQQVGRTSHQKSTCPSSHASKLNTKSGVDNWMPTSHVGNRVPVACAAPDVDDYVTVQATINITRNSVLLLTIKIDRSVPTAFSLEWRVGGSEDSLVSIFSGPNSPPSKRVVRHQLVHPVPRTNTDYPPCLQPVTSVAS